MRDALQKFLSTIQSTGGLLEFEDGTFAPAADPDWIDLGDAALAALRALEAAFPEDFFPLTISPAEEVTLDYGYVEDPPLGLPDSLESHSVESIPDASLDRLTDQRIDDTTKEGAEIAICLAFACGYITGDQAYKGLLAVIFDKVKRG